MSTEQTTNAKGGGSALVPDPTEGIAASRVTGADARAGQMTDKRTFLARRTWELELFISGAVVFTLVRLPSRLASGLERIMARLEESQQTVVFLGYTYVQLAIISITIALLVHLVARALWVGLIGLDAVFPDGIRWRRVTSSGPRFKAFYRARLLRLPKLIEVLDAFCNTIFSVAFAFAMIFISSIFVVGPLAWFASYVNDRFFDGARSLETFYAILLVVLGPLLIAQMVDRRVPMRPRRPFFDRLVRGILRPFHLLTGGQIYIPISFTLLSNISKRTFWLGYAGIFVILFVGFTLAILVGGGVVGFDGYRFAPTRGAGRAVEVHHYENLRDPQGVYTVPSIDGDVVDGPYLRLFLPYVPRNDNALIAERCGDLEPFRRGGFYFDRRRQRPLSDEEVARVEESARCLGGLYAVSLDDRAVDPGGFDFYEHPSNGMVGLLGHLPIRALAPGRHELRVGYRVEIGDDPKDLREHVIPFWK